MFNVPYGGKKSGQLPSELTLVQCAQLLRRAELVPGDFEAVLARTQPGDFVYLDPPFSVRGRRVFREYGPSVFGQDDVEHLKLEGFDPGEQILENLVKRYEERMA